MQKNEHQDAEESGPRDTAASDVARLYSWANLEGAVYRDFTRQRKAPPTLAEQAAGANRANGAADGTQSPAIDQPAVPGSSASLEVPREAFAQVQRPSSAPPSISLGNSQPAACPPDPPALRTGAARFATAVEEFSSDPRGSAPAVAVYSVAGGTGKTTLCANLAKALCSLGEEVLLVEATGRGLMPLYFGATTQRTGLRTFTSPGGDSPPIRVQGAEEVTPQWLDREVKPLMSRSQRVIFDLGPACAGVLPEIFSLCTVILVPLLPDLNSLMTVERIEDFLQSMRSSERRPLAAHYVLNCSDDHSARGRWARKFAGSRCGDRLLPMTIRRSPELQEGWGDGELAPNQAGNALAAHDYLEVALWLRRMFPAALSGFMAAQWIER